MTLNSDGDAYYIAEPTIGGGFRPIRRLTDRERERTAAAIDLVQTQGRPVAFEQLLITRDRIFEQFQLGLSHLRRHDSESATWELEIALTTWILYWRRYLDQTCADVIRRFGKPSDELAQLKSESSEAFDSSSSYRIVESLRNMLTHSGRIKARPIYCSSLGTDFHSYYLSPSELLKDYHKWSRFARADLIGLEGNRTGWSLPVDELVNEAMGALGRVARWVVSLNKQRLESASGYLSELMDGLPSNRLVVVGQEDGGVMRSARVRTPEPVRQLTQGLCRLAPIRQYGAQTPDRVTVYPEPGERVMVNLSADRMRRVQDEDLVAERMSAMNGQIGSVVEVRYGVDRQVPTGVLLSFDPYARSWGPEDLIDATYVQVPLILNLELPDEAPPSSA